MFRRFFAGIMLCCTILGMFCCSFAGDSHIVADPTAPGNQRPQVIPTGNGLPQVNINTPNGNGLSYNRYQQFDVGRQGAILNNSTKDIQTQLGGWIERNPNLAKGSASLIVNEVNSSRPSHLGGFIEIAGQRADVVIANPSGISVDGSGFINANRATLTTGVPRIESGNLAGFDVTGGRIDIQGQGLNAKGSNYTDIIAESAVINAGIWANQLNVVTGRNFVSGDTSSVTNIDPDAETGVSLDVKAVGGMYANQIRLVGTGRGVGVNSGMNNEGNIFAQVGEVHISEDGMLSNSGVISGQSGVNVAVGDEIVNTGSMQSGDELVMTGGKSIDNQAEILATGTASFTAKENFQNTETVTATGDLSVTTGGDINNENSITSGGVASFDAGKNISNTAEIQADGGLSLATWGGDLENTKNILTNSDLSFSITGNLINVGELGVAGKISGTITSGLNNSGQILAGSSDFTSNAALINTGLIDGGKLIIRAGSIDNIDTGTILGDHLSLMADTYILNGLPLGRTGTGTSGLIGARDRLDLAARDITNREDGLLYSAGDIYVGGTLDIDGIASGRAGTLLNASALIDAGGDFWATVDQFTNRNDHYKTELRVIRDESFQAVSLNARTYYRWGELGTWWGDGDYANIGGSTREDYYIHDVRIIEKDTFVIESRPGTIYTGGDFSVDGSLTNDHSRIVSGGTIQVAPSDKLTVTGSFTNIAAMEPYYYDESHWIHYTTVEADGWFGGHKREHHGGYSYAPPTVVKYNEKNVVLTPYASASVAEQSLNSAAPSVGSLSLNLNANMYTMNPSPTSEYLVETNPHLTDYRSWLSSDFMLERVAADPGTVLKRLGDGFYEQRLIRDQIANKTGLRYLEGHNSDEEQYLALMTAGVEFAEEFELALGVSLSAEQMEQLTSDIVWLEYVTVDTPEGPQQVLTPVVYLAPGRETVVNPAGTLASGKNIILDLNGEFANTGNVLGSEVVSVDADKITNGGNIAGGLVNLAAIRDIDNSGGRISGVDGVDLQAGGDIIIASTTQTGGRSGNGYSGESTTLDRVGIVEVTGENGSLSMDAGRNININAGIVSSTGDASLTAGRDVNIGVVEESLDYTTRADDKNGFDLSMSTDRGSEVAVGGDLSIKAGNDVSVTGSYVAGEGALNIKAGNDVTITEGRQVDDYNSLRHTTDDGFLRTKTNTYNSHTVTDDALSSSLSGDTINITAGNDFTLRGSDVAASSGVSVEAGGDIAITVADASSSSSSYKKETRDGFSGSFGGGSIGISYGSSEKGRETKDDSDYHVGSLIGSENGDVTLYAGKDVDIESSQVVAGTGDVAISGENVAIENTYDTYDHYEREYSKESSIGISVGLAGSAADAATGLANAGRTIEKAGNASSDRAGILYGIAGGREAYDAVKDAVGVATGGNPIGDLGLSISLGASSSSSEYTSRSHDEIVTGSSIISGGDTTIVARGEDGKEGTGDLTIIGSTVDAGGDVLLAANDDITLKSAEESGSYADSNKNSSSGMGVTVGIGAGGINNIGLNANASKGEGSGSGNTSGHVETVIRGDNVEFASVDDTTIKGGQIIGDSVVGTVGGDLTIISEQDSESHDRKQSSSGGGISVGMGIGGGLANVGGSYSSQNQKGKSDYDSVDEQSGIFAGEGGFDITVGGNTHLEGAVIASEADPEDNLLVTGSLTTKDIENNSSYEATTKGMGGEFSYEKNGSAKSETANKGSISPSLPMTEKDDDSSSTKSAVAEGTIVITDEESQLAKTGQTAEETIDDLNRDTANAHEGALDRNPGLQEIFDKQAELVEASAAAGKAVAKTVGDISQAMYAKNPDDKRWDEGGIYKVILQGAGAALVAQLGNGQGLDAALGAMASQLAAGKVADLAKELASQVSDDPSMQELITNIISNIISSGIGAAAGGESGSNLASTMDRNNRQLHGKETEWIVNHYKEFQDQLNAGKTKEDEGWIDDETAKALLAQAAARMVDEWYTKAIPETDLNKKYFESAQKYLLDNTKDLRFEYLVGNYTVEQEFFTTKDDQYENHMFLYDNKVGNSWEFYEKYVSSGVDKEKTPPEYNDTTKRYIEIYANEHPSPISKEMVDTCRAVGMSDAEIVANVQEMDAFLIDLAKSFLSVDTIEATTELLKLAESETNLLKKAGYYTLASVGAVAFIEDWAPTNKITGQAAKQVVKNVGSDILESAVKNVTEKYTDDLLNAVKHASKNATGTAVEVAKKATEFADESKLLDHFQKHGGEFAQHGIETISDYLELGKKIIAKNSVVEYVYNGEKRIGFVEFMGTTSKGEAKFALVGTNAAGKITTIHVESGKNFWKTVNGVSGNKVLELLP